MKILVATQKSFAPVAVTQIRAVIEEAGYTFVLLDNYKTKEDLMAAAVDADGLIVRSELVTGEILDSAKKLKIVVRAGAGYDNIDLKACSDRKIVVMNTPGQNSNAVAELAFLMMLYKARDSFNGKTGTELRGKSLGIHAFGNVGRYVAQIAGGFGMKVYAYDPFLGHEDISRHNVIPCNNISDLYSSCQYISLHLPSNDKTNKSITADLLRLMPKGAVLVNTARKEVIDEDGLLKVFEEREDFSYLSDIEPDSKAVFEEKYVGRYFFTPKKMGAQTKEANMNAGIAASRQIVDFFTTGNEKFRVN